MSVPSLPSRQMPMTSKPNTEVHVAHFVSRWFAVTWRPVRASKYKISSRPRGFVRRDARSSLGEGGGCPRGRRRDRRGEAPEDGAVRPSPDRRARHRRRQVEGPRRNQGDGADVRPRPSSLCRAHLRRRRGGADPQPRRHVPPRAHPAARRRHRRRVVPHVRAVLEALLRDHGEDRGDAKREGRRRGRRHQVPTRELGGGVANDRGRVRGLEGRPVHRRAADAEHRLELFAHDTDPVPGRRQGFGLRAVRASVPVRG
mmetsp:Transcript_2230/g.8653  ORF Transcript_2230/g.8653 Transcript_2230/m.8653 type:complete len:257 (+) Transcript_2230:411-1181(+)